MESNDVKIDHSVVKVTDETQTTAVNSVILDYYKKFGRKRDLEQYFSLSTAQGEERDPAGLFWRRMKSQTDSSDSGEKKSESSTELCRISIRCSVSEQNSSQDEESKGKSDSESPPIIIEDTASRHTDDDSIKSDDNHSQKSIDAILDISINKPLSPSSSITSQRRLEWDSLADVGYGNESDRKTSGSSLSTLERLALKQQYANNDTKPDTDLGPPTAHSTPFDQVDSKIKYKKSFEKKTTMIHNKDIDVVNLNMPHSSDSHPQAINVNLTKHISFNVEKDGGVTVENIVKDISISPEKISVETEGAPQIKFDKEIQTTLTKPKEKTVGPPEEPEVQPVYIHRVPVLINLNTLRKRNRRNKLRNVRRKMRAKKNDIEKENIPIHEKSGGQVSEAESFEYLPGHIYNQNQLKHSESKLSTAADNKSSLESSGALTTDSSKGSEHSFTKDLDKSIDVIKAALQNHYDDSNIKKKLIKEVVRRLIKSRYRDDDSTTDFLSRLSFHSKKLGLGESHTTTSTSEGNHTGDKSKLLIPKKSILRLDKFNSIGVPSTSQSAPNLQSVSNNENFISNLTKVMTSSNTESDVSGKGRNSSETGFAKTSSEELYQKYLEALRREEAYKKHLRDKEHFLRQKLVSSDTAFKVPAGSNLKTNDKLKDLLKDLTRNNYDNGSGDANRLETGSKANSTDFERFNVTKKQRSHSVYTLSSGNSDGNKKNNLKKRLQKEIRESKTGNSTDPNCQCGCQMHSKNFKIDLVDSSVQVNINHLSDNNSSMESKKKLPIGSNCCKASTNKPACFISDNVTGDVRYVCLCSEQALASQNVAPNMYIYKCSRLQNKSIQFEMSPSIVLNNASVQCIATSEKQGACEPSTSRDKILNNDVIHYKNDHQDSFCGKKVTSQSSQTNIDLACATIFQKKCTDKSSTSSSESNKSSRGTGKDQKVHKNQNLVLHEATRCIQTEISINPKISDPVLTDVNIIEDGVELIDEKYRNISKKNLERDSIHRSSSCTDVDIGSDRFGQPVLRLFDGPGYPDHNIGVNCCLPLSMPTLDKEVQSNIKANNIESHTMTEPTGDNYEIPIQGTNMKLMVTIGSNTRESPPVEQNNNDTVTIQTRGIDKLDTMKSNLSLQESHTIAREAYCIDKIQIPANKFSLMEEKHSIASQTCTDVNEYTENKSPPVEQNNTVEKQECGIVNINITGVNEKSCLTEKSSKGELQTTDKLKDIGKVKAQSQTLDINADMDKVTSISQDINNCNRADTTNNIILLEADSIKHFDSRKSCIVKTFDVNNKKCNTYPRSVQINESRPFKRSNTDSNSIKDATCFQADWNFKKDAPMHESKSEVKKDDTESQLDKYSNKESLRYGTSSKEAEDTLSDDPVLSCKYSSDSSKDPILDIIKDITRRYSKKDIEKDKRKKCFKEIINVLNYLLATEDGNDNNLKRSGSFIAHDIKSDKEIFSKISNNNNEADSCSKLPDKHEKHEKIQKKSKQEKQDKANVGKGRAQSKMIDKSVQLSPTKFEGNHYSTESSEIPKSTDLPTSTDSATCKVLNKIKRECEKYHQKRCKSFHTAAHKCEASSSTSMNCDQCQRVHHCSCRGHKCKGHKHRPSEKIKQKCVAYNLIIQTSDSMISEEISTKNTRPLKNIIVKVPSKRKQMENVPFKELSAKIEKNIPNSIPRHGVHLHRSRSLPNESEVSSVDECDQRHQECSVRDYLEKNRPEFVERSSDRQNCLKIISERRNPSACAPPNMKMVVVHQPSCMGSMDAHNLFCGGIPMTCFPSVDQYSPNNQIHHAMQSEVTRIADERAAHRKLLSLQLATQPDVSAFSEAQLRNFAKELGFELRHKKLAPKFISEKEMKKHSEKIYKSLPEVVQKKEDKKKENIKKTNLVMANIFKKNLQKKTLRGTVNLSNYSTVIKI